MLLAHAFREEEEKKVCLLAVVGNNAFHSEESCSTAITLYGTETPLSTTTFGALLQKFQEMMANLL